MAMGKIFINQWKVHVVPCLLFRQKRMTTQHNYCCIHWNSIMASQRT